MKFNRIIPTDTLKKKYADYLAAISRHFFQGEIRVDYATRLSVATDNSIYQVIPQAVIFPKTTQDIALLFKISYQEIFRTIQFSPRGGGTGPNGQSLTAGIIIDCSKYMREILEINTQEAWVRVQPGVVLDALNQYLHAYGYYFAPQVSTSNRATIGGMVNTDACGNGSRLLGRTRDHVLELTYVSTEGEINQVKQMPITALSRPLHQEIYAEVAAHQTLIEEKFKNVPRTLNGYNLAKIIDKKTDQFNLTALLCGSEGTLAVIAECKLKLTPLAKFKKLVVIQYKQFSDALRAPEITTNILPSVIETLDEKLIELARQDRLYHQIKDFLDVNHTETQSINLVEFSTPDEKTLEESVAALCANVRDSKVAVGCYVTKNSEEAALFWDLRKKSVGLISKACVESKRPIPFIEDTAVPPEKLADYIIELKKILDSYGLIYGMYGHIDAGCVHVRPALNLTLEQDEKMLRELSDKVVALIEKFGGVLWGEHGMGYRSEYAEKFFGKELYAVVRKIKTFFDPFNQLNPGKVAVSLASEGKLVKLEDNLRGHFDKQIFPHFKAEFPTSMACNGNGACFNYVTKSTMCPSYRVTGDRIHSPKGRSVLLREWLRQLSLQKIELAKNISYHFSKKILFTLQKKIGKKDFSHEVYDAMQGCLSCKACKTECPLSVDVPAFKAKFLWSYHQRYLRPLKDYLIAAAERIAMLQFKFPKIFNACLSMKLTRYLAKHLLGICDLPLAESHRAEITTQDFAEFQALTGKKVILLQDVFTTVYDSLIVTHLYALLKKLGFHVWVMPLFENGKGWHVKGFLPRFEKIAAKNIKLLRELAADQVPMVGVDPSITLTYRDEYAALSASAGINIQLPQEFLSQYLPLLQKMNVKPALLEKYYLFMHCTEQAVCVEAEEQWSKIFLALGLDLTILPGGCCGMAGSYGHEVSHYVHSKRLFAMDWQRYIVTHGDANEFLLATGYSCRSQAARFSGRRLQHPIEILADKIAV